MHALYLGSDSGWAHAVLAKALGVPLEAAVSETEALFHGSGSYDLIFLDLTDLTGQSWEHTISRLWHQDLRVVVISPQPNFREARSAMFAGAVGYSPKTDSIEDLAGEIARAATTPAHHSR
ncbi:MAG: hypothetical protein AAB486_02750 [Patescibacteria group bacterium]